MKTKTKTNIKAGMALAMTIIASAGYADTTTDITYQNQQNMYQQQQQFNHQQMIMEQQRENFLIQQQMQQQQNRQQQQNWQNQQRLGIDTSIYFAPRY